MACVKTILNYDSQSLIDIYPNGKVNVFCKNYDDEERVASFIELLLGKISELEEKNAESKRLLNRCIGVENK